MPFFLAGFLKKNDSGVSNILRQGCTEAKNRKQELTGKEVAKKIAKKTERASAGEGGETVLNNAVNYS